MDIKRSPVISDGPEYSRLSESLNQPHWYAEGHTDPEEEREQRERARSQLHEERKRRAEMEDMNLGKGRFVKQWSVQSNTDQGVMRGDGGIRSKPRDPQDLSPKKTTPKQGGRSPRSIPQGETIGLQDNPVDEESTPPSQNTRATTTSPTGAHYIPATSIQDPVENQDTTSDRPLLPEGHSSKGRGRCRAVSMTIGRALIAPQALVFTALNLAFSIFCVLIITNWLKPHLEKIVYEKVVLRPSSFSPSSPMQNANVRLEVFFYNVTYIKDAKGTPHIHFQDLGPYTYLVKSNKTGIKWHRNSTVSYRIEETFQFMPNHSVGNQSDVINTMDATVLDKLSKMDVGKDAKKFHVNLTDKIIRPQTVRDILMGEDDQDVKEPVKGLSYGQRARRIFNIFRDRSKQTIRNSKKTNKSTSPVYNVYTGKNEICNLNKVYQFNHTIANRMWPYGHDHYPMSGSADGDVFPPFVEKGQTLAFFYSQTERNLLLQRQKSVTIRGREAYRFLLPRHKNKGKKEEEELAPMSDRLDVRRMNDSVDNVVTMDDDVGKAKSREAFALQYLRRDSPFVVSFEPRSYAGPHKNHSQLCDIHLDIHPASGITLRKRLCHQMSLPVAYPGPKGHGFILPIMWVDWFYESVADNLAVIQTTYDILHVVEKALRISWYMMLTLAVALLIQVGATVFLHRVASDVYLILL